MSRVAAVLIPTLNEAAMIGGLLAQLSRNPPELVAEILVADGGSTDATRAVVETARHRDRRIRLIDNPDRIQSAGLNRAATMAGAAADTLIRIDAHAVYPDDFVVRALTTMTAVDASMLAVRLVTVGTTCTQRGIAAASNSRFGTGGARHRVGGVSGFVDHGHHAGIDRALFDRLGGYDPGFMANEDAELDLRVRRAGGRIWLQTDLTIDYAPRSTLSALARQYWRYGRGRAMTFAKHGERLRLRQCLPPVAVIAIGIAAMVAPFTPAALLVPAAYLALLVIAALTLFRYQPDRCTLIALPALLVMHMTWGLGFLVEVVRGLTNRPTERRVCAVRQQRRSR